MKEPKDFTCLMLVGFKIISSRFNLQWGLWFFMSYNLMLNSGKKIALCVTKKKKKNSNSRVVRKKYSERQKKP
jgi:hypothetical protein